MKEEGGNLLCKDMLRSLSRSITAGSSSSSSGENTLVRHSHREWRC